jgi:ketosteroid isomerase-like protein
MLERTKQIEDGLAEEIINDNLRAAANVKIIQEKIYGAFGSGDIPGLLGALAEDVDWQFYGPTAIPFAGRYRGREEMMRFFGTIAETAEIKTFEPREFIAQGEQVVVLGYEKVGVKGNGRVFESNWVHVFTVREGLVVKLREFYDTAALAAAYA